MLGARSLGLLIVAYLASLFAVAALVDRSAQSGLFRRLSRHPAATALALGAYSTTWTFFASVGFAATEGWRILASQMGATLSCALVPVVWAPLARVVKARQLASLADLFAYRYQSREVAGLVTVLFVVSSLPYQALQLHSVVEMLSQLGGVGARGPIAAALTGVLVLFGVFYGVRHLTPRERHDGLVAAVAFESIVKLLAHLALAGFVLLSVFGGARGLQSWLTTHPASLAAMTTPARDASWAALLLAAGAGIFLMPRQWHIAFTEGDERGLRAASFGLPAYLLLLNLSVPLVLWAGQALSLTERPDFYALGLVRASRSELFGVIVFLGGLAAATAMILVTTVALAGMVQNHLLLPLTGVTRGPGELYPRLRWVRRALVAAIILLGYAVYLVSGHYARLVDLGLVAFVAVVQLVPGVIGVLAWPRATARGVIAGLLAGIACWIATPVIPLFAGRAGLPFETGTDLWTFSTALSLGANGIAFVWASLQRPPTEAERDAAELCKRQIEPPSPALADLVSPAGFIERLAPVLGPGAAEKEVARALSDLGLDLGEARAERLQALREQMERNLTGLLGPMTARMIVDERLTIDTDWRNLLSAQLRHVEQQIAAARLGADLHGLAAELDLVRRYLRSLLEEMPIGVCALGPDGSVVVWNRALERLTGIEAPRAVNRRSSALPEPWASLLVLGGPPLEGEQRDVAMAGGARSLRIHRTPLDAAFLGAPSGSGGASKDPHALAGELYLLEDHTERLALAARLARSERLAALGTMSAVLAHEIKNPLAALKGNAQLLVEVLPEGARADADRVVEQAVRLEGLIHNLLDFARSGPLSRAAVDPAELVRAAAASAAPKAAVDVAGAPPSWPLDEIRIRQVIENLLRNAEQASPGETQVIVSVDRGALVVIVRDSGPGFSASEAAKIFEPFHTTKARGVGLGLTFAKRIVEMHGGAIEARNRPEGGAELRVSIPRG